MTLREAIIECQPALKQLNRDIDDLAIKSKCQNEPSISIFRNI